MALKTDYIQEPYETTSNPTANNDSVDTAGIGAKFIEGSQWLNTALDRVFICAASDVGAAIWKEVDQLHASEHQDSGIDEISVAGLSGVLADKQDADKLQGRNIDSSAPSDGQILAWDNDNSKWVPADASGSGLAQEQELHTVSGTETNIELDFTPVSTSAMKVYLNGLLMNRVDSTPSGINEYYYNSSLNRVEFNATSEEVWYYISSATFVDSNDASSLRGHNIEDVAPADMQFLQWNNGASQWEPTTASGTLHSYEDEFITTSGTETTMALTEVPYEDKSLLFARNGLILRRVLSTPSGVNEYYYNSELSRVEFNASNEDSWYLLRFSYT